MWSRFTSSPVSPAHKPIQIVIFGAGNVGCFLGAKLAESCEVSLIMRQSRIDSITQAGGIEVSVAGKVKKTLLASLKLYLCFEDVVRSGVVPNFVILTCKRTGLVSCLKELVGHEELGFVLVPCFNGGLAESEILSVLPTANLCSCIWPWGIYPISDASFALASETGQLHLTASPSGNELVSIFKKAGLHAGVSKDIELLYNGRLIMAMNGAINALSGLPLKDQVSLKGYRNLISSCLEETLAVYKAANVKYHPPFSLFPSERVPSLLHMPDFLFTRTMGALMSIDARAKSPIHYDLLNGKKTEIDYIQGVVHDLGLKYGVPTPTISRIIELVKKIEGGFLEGNFVVVPLSPEDIMPLS